jgi:hypothetical protein
LNDLLGAACAKGELQASRVKSGGKATASDGNERFTQLFGKD